MNFDVFKKFAVKSSKKIIGGQWQCTTLDGVPDSDEVEGDYFRYECGYEVWCVDCRNSNGNFSTC